MDLKIKNCLICSSHDLKQIRRYKSHHLVKCKSCGFVFSNKVPTKEELFNVYNGYSRNDYLSPITVKRYNELLDKFEKYRETNNILDIGCGIGYFLEQAKKRGWNVYGTEFTDEAVQICKSKGITTLQGDILSVKLPENIKFDIITSFEVIEHINNPHEEIKEYKRLLRQGGIFYVTTPNFNSLSRFLLKEKWNIIAYPEHLSYYTGKTIKKLFNENGFKCLNVRTENISIVNLKKVIFRKSNKIEQRISENSTDEGIRRVMESRKLKFVKNIINFLLSLFGIGDTVKSFMKKV